MKHYIISEDLLKSILTYLIQKPYSEVADAIAVLTALSEAAPAPSKDTSSE